jgi:hypothetical protein
VPADGRPARVLGDQGLAQCLRGKAGEGCDTLAQREQEDWDRRRFPEGLTFEVIGPTEGDDTAPSDMAVEAKGGEVQPCESCEERAFLLLRDRLTPVPEARWQGRRQGEKVELVGRHAPRP